MRYTFLSILSALLVTGCAVGPDYKAPQQPSSVDRWFSQAKQQQQPTEIKTDWWTVFNDPQLEKYIQIAAAQNKEIAASRANIERSRALRRQAIAPYFPVISTDASHTRQGTSGATASTFSAGARRTTYSLGLDASWEIDLFGGSQRSNEAAKARVESAIDNRRAVLLSILAETARGYYDVRGIQKRIAITQKNIDLQEHTYKLIDTLFNSGEASEFDLSRAHGQLELTLSRMPDLDAEMKAGIFRLSVLLGQPPEALLEDMLKSKPLPVPPNVVPVGLRSDILRRRPDVRTAERNLAASTADIGVAIADLYPRFSLTGELGRSASLFGDLSDPISNTFSFAQILQWPVFQGGAIRANIKVQESEAQQAAALYEQAVLNSLADAESALTRYLQKLKSRNRLQSAVKSRTRAVELARALFNSGEEDFLSVLDSERELTSAEDALVLSETATLLNLITLYTVLGGGWEVFENDQSLK